MWVFFGDCEKALLHVGGDGWLKLLNIGGGSCDRLLNTGGGGGGSIGGIKSLNADGDGGDESLSFLLLLLLWSILKILFFLKASSHFIMPSVGLVLVPFQQDHSQWIFLPVSSSLSTELTTEFCASNVFKQAKTSSRGFCCQKIIFDFGCSLCLKIALFSLSCVT